MVLDPKIQFPTLPTLKKYGLVLDDWIAILESQGGVCAICKKVPSTGRFVVDHEHRRGFKTMKPEDKRKYVRGILDWYCNHTILRKGITPDKLRNAAQYLDNYKNRLEQ